jgi:hypothetical protein
MAIILELQVEQLKVAFSLNTANKSKLEILGTTQITFTIGTQVKVARMVVARNLAHDMILGTDFNKNLINYQKRFSVLKISTAKYFIEII